MQHVLYRTSNAKNTAPNRLVLHLAKTTTSHRVMRPLAANAVPNRLAQCAALALLMPQLAKNTPPRRLAWIVLSALLVLPLTAAAEETYEAQAERVREDTPREQFLTVTIENDLFGGAGTDRNYTNGVRVAWLDTSERAPEIGQFVADYLPIVSINDTTAVYYSLGHNIYTPQKITRRNPDPNDRPYAAFLYGSVGMSTIIENHQDDIELTLGVVGPMALGKGVQKFFHDLVDTNNPSGWEHQLRNEPGLMVSGQRLWPEMLTAELAGLHFRVSPYAGATLGNIYTYANTGLMLQLVPTRYKWQSSPLRVRPAIPGSGYFSVPEETFAWSIFAGVEGRGVARNIFLDGNTFRDGPSVDKKYLVGDANIGVAFTYGRTQLTYTLNWRSEEFEGQTEPDIFGAVGLGYRF